MKFEQIVSVLDQVASRLDKVLSIFTIVLLGVMAVIVNVGVFYRYVLMTGLPWSEEVPKFCMIWMGFIGTSMALRRDQHIGFYAVIQRLPEKTNLLVKLFGYFLILSFLIILIRWGFFLAFTVGPYSVSPQTGISYFWLLLIVPLAGILMTLQLFMKILWSILSLVGNHQ